MCAADFRIALTFAVSELPSGDAGNVRPRRDGACAELGQNALKRPGDCIGPDMDFSIAAAGTRAVVIDISPKALGPTRGLGTVLGGYALKEPGDCDAARRELDDTKDDESQDSQRAIQFGLRWAASHAA